MFLAFFLAGTAAAQSKIYYVSSRATDTGDGSSWANATTLTKALDKAVAGDQIWVQGFETLTGDNLYVAPKKGFAVKSGVQLYGGFAGTESRLSQRVTLGKPYQLKYRSVLSGDIQKNDTVGSVDLIFPANGTRSDNATHVLSVNLDPTQASGNNNTYPTVINGFSIGNGQAAGTGDAGKGGGIYVYGDNSKGGVFRIERCFLISNYATQGGAVYVDASVKSVNGETSLINQSVVFNNAAGDRAAVENQAGGIYLAGVATVVNTSIFNNGNGGVRLSSGSKVVNATIARNTGAGVDMTAGGSGDAHVYNSIIWGNTQLYLQNDPGFRNSAYHEVVSSDPATPDENGNIYVAKENRGDKFGPMFDAPSVKTSYDRDFNWRESAYPLWSWNVLEGSVMIDKGHNDYYDQNVYGSEDMAGNPRISGDRISVGAYEYQYLPATRIRYVKPTATGTGDGSSWDNASGDLQKMIDELADNNVSQQAGEVWVAAGTYKPQSQLISGMNYSASFRMRDGISVYGGFEGDETSKQERAKGTMPWDFTNVTVLEAAYYESKLAWTNSKWTVGSDSRHVVWFAPMSGESDFTRITTLDGVTVQGGYNDPKTATITVPVTTSGQPVYLYGGYHRTTDNNTVIRDPLTYRSVINGNTEGKDITQGLYHCITVERGAKLVLDGFHVINGYAAGEASRQYGAGLLAHAGSEVTVRNCIFENNTAQEGAAIDAREAVLTMENCVVNNNTNTTTTASVITAQSLTMEHVTVANNVGAAPATMGASSFSVGNTNGNSLSLASTGADGAKNFANPTNKAGATLGFDTYLGGYSVFRPLTSSEAAGTHIINKVLSATSLSADITTINDRNLGGVPDLGAYEADLPKAGSVYYVRTDGNDNSDGLSWEHALRTVTAALDKTEEYSVAANRPRIWVAAGTYTGTIDDNDKIHSQPYAYKMVEGVNVYGGFPDSGAPGEDDRDPNTYKTILQAQENKPEYPTRASASAGWKNVGRVLVQRDHFGVETVWDGLVFRYGSLNTGYRYSITGNIMNLDTKIIGECGGAGVYMMGNSVLENCVIENNLILADKKNIISNSGGIHTVAGGVFCRGGVIRNCQIINNSIRVYSQQEGGNGAAFSYGGGLYILNDDKYTAAIFNSLISGNRAEALEWNNETVTYHTMAIGAGACQISGNFYNNTIVGNTAKTENSTYSNIMCGGMFVYDTAEIYNCIIYNNKEEGGRNIGISSPRNLNLQVLSVDIPEGSSGDKPNNDGYSIMKERIHVYYSNVGYTDADGNAYESSSLVDENVTYASRNNVSGYPNFVGESTGDYHLLTGSPAINTGTEVIPNAIIPDYDADYTNRIKDCGIDMGAFESTNEGNVLCTETQEDGRTIFTYYVSQNGVGLRSGENPANAACATKLQAILTDAGKKVSTNTSASAIVKVAGYEDASFVYNANTLASAIDPQSYTYVIPEGVTLMGGYYDGNYNDGDYEEGSGWDDATGDNMRNPMKFRTVLSAIAKPSQGSTITQEVNGYHTVTFGAWPGTAALTKSAIIDGVWLEDGSATSLAGAGNPNTRGGGAIVPSGAHVRNCVVRNCAATEGGGLYLMPGATVSGTLIMNNSAENGGGVYADSTNVKADSRAHILSSTIAGNTAFTSGGGLYMEDGAVMNVNTVIFGNTAGSDKNVSGVINTQFADNKLSSVYGIDGKTNFYPFNDCFVETQEMPSDFENTRLESDSTLYFTGDFYQLKDYSLLIKHGLKNKYQEKETQADPSLVTTFNVAKSDMQNIVRVQTGNGAERLDAGAFAYEGGILPTELFTRIFVSQTTNVTLPDNEDMNKYLGRSFYTSFSTLEDALGYIRSMRDKGHNDNFEILVAGGTYKPSNERNTTAAVTHDQRLYSFEVPQGVSIYGGFVGTEFISSKVQDGNDLTTIPGVTGTFTCMGDITDILNARTYSDFNQNGINEPWELANQTILSGQINASSTAQNAYHVVFTDKGTATTANPVVLDGLTVMNGETDNQLSISTDENEQGRGGGIYSNGVTYTISRCRLLNNTAVRGGAVFVRDADLNLSGCILAGNQTVTNAAQGTNTLTSRGGAAYVSGISRVVSLRAVNTLWANNESADEGGAIGTNYAGVTSAHDPFIYILNNTFVRNKAAKNPVLYNHNGKSELVNTLIWGNDGASYDDATSVAEIYSVSHCASDVDYVNKFASGNDHNILLSTDNMGDKGPRFTNPSTVAGADGNSASNLWNPAAISVLTDAGDGTEHTTLAYPDETGHKDNATTGAYQQWFNDNTNVKEAYITGGTYSRYSGPYGEDNTPMCKPIDIGLYEYQYVSNFSTMLKIYVDTLSVGNGSGDSWANATDDLRGAIVGASNPTVQAGTRRIFVRDGKYTWSRLSAGSAYILNMSDNSLSDLLILKGSCTGSGEQQDFSKPTVVRNDVETPILMSVTANGKDVVFEGFTFANHSASETAKGMEVSVQSNGSLTLKNCGFRQNPVGLNVEENSGPVLIYNTLFADGGTGLVADGNTTVVNATFAQNTTDLDMTNGTPAVYNSVAWKNGTQNLTTDTEKKNVAILGTVDNDDVLEGPNFVDPDNADMMSRDYRIRPNLLLLNKGNKKHYTNYALGLTAADAAIPADEKDLANNARLTGDEIDVGAYEYEATLKPIVYVKADLTGTADGNSWTTALGDLQGAVDLAGIYVNGNPGEHAYVFVHNNYRDAGLLNLSMPGVKVYGGMNDETSAATDVSGIVSDLLTQRKGMLESTGRSLLQDVTLGTDVVVDGFVVNGAATVNNGILSTSILNGAVAGQSDGVLYNSLALNSVSDVKAVNVTATGTIADVTGSGNNRASVTETNSYVTTDYWKYQLMETSSDIDPAADTRTDISRYTTAVGHSRDLIGNKRIRNTVDNGCFETWNITSNYMITADDKPVGQSVVYVRKEKELQIQKAEDGSLVYPDGQYFNPGYLLLEHQAGLRGCGNYINLTNFAVERDVKAGGNDLTVMPFDVTDVTPNAGYSLKRYNGSTRAAYYFTCDSTNGNAWTDGMAWTDQDFANRGETEGFLIENTSTDKIKVRFSGDSYSEGGADNKSVVLMKYNFNDPWTSTTSVGNRFTHKENMSWNLFGSPYLCAMNYGDMAYGRVLYGYTADTYKTVNTANETAGYIPAGDAVFTQTATLRERESVSIALPSSSGRQGDAYASSARLQLTLSPAEATRATADGASAADVLQLNAVPADEARQDFDLGADGVKWMSTAAVPQLYAVRSGNRYSLLSAVSEEGETALGVTAPKAGVYQLGIAGNEGYETVELTDHLTGRTVDLTTSAYTFTLPADTCLDHRFTLRFRTLSDEGADGGIRIRLQDDGSICVSGLEPGQRIQAYSVGGQLEWKHVATESQCVFRLQRGVHVVEVREGGTKRAVSKLMVP